MDPVIKNLLMNIPFAGMGTTLERNGLIGVVRNLIKANKYTVDYILNYCESVGYQRNMAEEVFEELTGISPKLIINNNEYYNAPIYVPACTIAWGLAKTKPNVAFYVVPGSYGYSVMEKNETDVPTEVIQTATIPEAIDELKKVAKKIQTLDKIITSKLLETEDVATIATDPNQTDKPYAAVDPVFELKKNFKNKVIDINGFEREAKRLVAEEKISLEDAEDLLNWEQDIINEDESYANEVLQHNEEWKPLEAEEDIPFDKIYEEFKAISSEDEDILGGKEKAEILYRKNKTLFKNCDLLQCAERLYQLMLGFNKEEILGHSKYVDRTENKLNKKAFKVHHEKGIVDFDPWSGAIDTKEEIIKQGKADEFDAMINELYPNGIDATKLNDLLWFEADWIYQTLGMKNPYEDEEEIDASLKKATNIPTGNVPTEKITLTDGRTFTVRYNPKEKGITTIFNEDGKEIGVDAATRLQLLRKLFHKGEPTIVNKSASKKVKSGEEIDKINLDFMKDIDDTSYALKLLRDGIVTRESRHFDSLVEMILNSGEDSAAPLELLRLGILNENDRYYHNAIKQSLKSPTYAQSLLELGIITKNSEYYMDAVNSALRYDWQGKELVEKGIIDEKYVEDEFSRKKEELRSALSEAILILRENGERFYDLKLVWQDKNKSIHDLKQALNIAAERLEKAGLYEDAEYCRGILKQASKKIKSASKKVKSDLTNNDNLIEGNWYRIEDYRFLLKYVGKNAADQLVFQDGQNEFYFLPSDTKVYNKNTKVASKKVTSSKIIQVNVYDIDWNFDELDEEDKPTEKLPDFYNNLNIEIDEDAEDFEMTKDDIEQMIDDSISKELFNEFGYYPESYNWTYSNKKSASKKVTAENITLEDMEEEDNKSESEKEVEKINETPIDELLEDNTPLDFFEKETQDDKVDTINDVVSKCITEFSDKFKDFDKYDIKMLSYKTKILDPYTPTQDEMIQDEEVNADAVLQVILGANNKADESAVKKLLVVFSITDGKMHWTGTVRDEDNNIVAFTEEGLDSIFNEPEEITEDII